MTRAASDRPTAELDTGHVLGMQVGQVLAFLGIRYAAPPSGARRFASPRPAEPWPGMLDASHTGPPFWQKVGDEGDEDALRANVWTPGLGGRRPVVVYIHGGGWQVGSAGRPTYDGSRLCADADVVVVSFNYRLGGFGWGRHDDLIDDETGEVANWGLRDQAALLHWVQRNAEAVGGDPSNVTLCGTSAGASSAWHLARRPHLRALLNRLVVISPCPIWEPFNALSPQDSHRCYEMVARTLSTTVPGLRRMPAQAVRDAWETIFRGLPESRAIKSGREYRGPVVDGRWAIGADHASPDPDLPTLLIHTRNEGAFYTAPDAPFPITAPTDEASLVQAVHRVLLKGMPEIDAAEARRCVRWYREAAADSGEPTDPWTLWTEVWGDAVFRFPILCMARRRVQEGNSPMHLMEFTYRTKPPFAGAPHEGTSPFLFGTYRHPQNQLRCGDGPLESQVQASFASILANFTNDGEPIAAGLPPWPRLRADAATPILGAAPALILGGAAGPTVAPAERTQRLRYWENLRWGPAA